MRRSGLTAGHAVIDGDVELSSARQLQMLGHLISTLRLQLSAVNMELSAVDTQLADLETILTDTAGTSSIATAPDAAITNAKQHAHSSRASAAAGTAHHAAAAAKVAGRSGTTNKNTSHKAFAATAVDNLEAQGYVAQQLTQGEKKKLGRGARHTAARAAVTARLRDHTFSPASNKGQGSTRRCC